MMSSKELAELVGIRSILVSMSKDLKMLEDRIATLEYVAGAEMTIEEDVGDDFPSDPLVSHRDSYDTMNTKIELDNWRTLKKVPVGEHKSGEQNG